MEATPDTSKVTPIIAVLALIALAVAGYLYYTRVKSRPQGAVETAKQATESVPEVPTNAAQKVPELNPIDQANPFKYKNPLR